MSSRRKIIEPPVVRGRQPAKEEPSSQDSSEVKDPSDLAAALASGKAKISLVGMKVIRTDGTEEELI